MFRRLMMAVSLLVLGACSGPAESPDAGELDAGSGLVSDAGNDAGSTQGPDAGSDAGTTDAGQGMDAGLDAGVPDGGYATLTGSLAFNVQTARSFAARKAGTANSPDFTHLGIGLLSVDYPCQNPTNPAQGPGHAMVIDAILTDGGVVKGNLTVSFPDIQAYVTELNPDGGSALRITPMFGTFTFDYPGFDLQGGITGSLNLTSQDGGTLQGTFGASYCGTY